MRRSLSLLSLLLLPATLPADEPEWTEFTLSPRAVADHPLKYEVYPNDVDRHEGDAAPILLRQRWERLDSLMTQMHSAADHLGKPLEAFSPDEVREAVPLVGYDELRRAGLRTTAEWEYPLRETDQLYNVLLPDVQGLRAFMRMLAVHARIDVVEGRTDEALDKIRTGMSIGEHIGRTPFFVNKLVQVVTQEMFLTRIEELIGRDDSPNLYWALTRLPRPMVDLSDTADWERRFILAAIPELVDLEEDRTPEEWTEIGSRIVHLMQQYTNEWEARIEKFGGEKQAHAAYLKRARERLPKLRPDLAERVGEMSDAEVGVRYFGERVLPENQHAVSILSLTAAEAVQLAPILDARRTNWAEEEPELDILVMNFGNGMFRARSIDRRIAALRIVEALRDHAARHDGAFPETLGDLGLPVPVDPFTDRAFEYSLRDGVVELVGPPVQRGEDALFGVHLRLRWRAAD